MSNAHLSPFVHLHFLLCFRAELGMNARRYRACLSLISRGWECHVHSWKGAWWALKCESNPCRRHSLLNQFYILFIRLTRLCCGVWTGNKLHFDRPFWRKPQSLLRFFENYRTHIGCYVNAFWSLSSPLSCVDYILFTSIVLFRFWHCYTHLCLRNGGIKFKIWDDCAFFCRYFIHSSACCDY